VSVSLWQIMMGAPHCGGPLIKDSMRSLSLIVSGRDLGDLNQTGKDWNEDCSALEIARKKNETEVVAAREIHSQPSTDPA